MSEFIKQNTSLEAKSYETATETNLIKVQYLKTKATEGTDEKDEEDCDDGPLNDDVDAFLNKIPPDWEKAEMHGLANGVVFDTLLNL